MRKGDFVLVNFYTEKNVLTLVEDDVSHVDLKDIMRILDHPEITTLGQRIRYKFKNALQGLK